MSIKENISRFKNELALECARVGRDPEKIIIVAASKYAGIDGIMQAYEAGLRVFGENRVQDALPKMNALPKDIEWHFIGHLQGNKVTKVVGTFSMIHSVDSFELAKKIDSVASERKISQRVMLEINMSGEESKYGLVPESAEKIAPYIAILHNIEFVGLMTMAPLIQDTIILKDIFRGLRELRDRIENVISKPIPFLSMGMTNDWRIALEEGATHLRIGSAIFIG